MLPTDDHSFFEIMLGAESYVPVNYRMALGLHDLGQLWPPNVTITTGNGRRFSGADVWRAVGKRLQAPAGAALLGKMSPEAASYVRGLVAQAEDADGCGDEVEA